MGGEEEAENEAENVETEADDGEGEIGNDEISTDCEEESA